MTPEAQARLLHHRKPGLSQGDPVVPPITASATFHLPSVQSGGQFYGRNGNPSWDAVEAQLAILEDAEVVSFPSGMAAISAALFATLTAGDRLIVPADGYYVTRVLSEGFLKPLGIGILQLPTLDYETADFRGAAVVYLETPSNPGLDVVDIAAAASRAKAAGARVIVDNTTMTPLLQRPLDLGADLVVAADTKAPAGHSDVLFGHVAGRDAALMARVRDWRRMAGAIPGPFEAFLVHRGIETLEVRLDRMCASALTIAGRRADGERGVPDRLHPARYGCGGGVPRTLPPDRADDQLWRHPQCGGTPRALGRCRARGVHPPVGRDRTGRGPVAGDRGGAGGVIG
jgi:cystathionine gamma-lyase